MGIKPSNTQLKTTTPISSQNHNICLKTLTIGSGKSNPLPLVWLIHGDAPKLNPKLPLLLKIILIFSSCSSHSKTLFFPLCFYFWQCRKKNGKKTKEKGFYKVIFLLAITISMFGFDMQEWKENEEKGFIMVFLLVSQG